MKTRVIFKTIELNENNSSLSSLITTLQIALDCAEQGNIAQGPLVDIEYYTIGGYMEICGYREETEEEKNVRQERERDSKRIKLLQYNSLKKELGL